MTDHEIEKETRYQRIAREQRERQALRAERQQAYEKKMRAANRKYHARADAARRERKWSEWLISDHNHDMDG